METLFCQGPTGMAHTHPGVTAGTGLVVRNAQGSMQVADPHGVLIRFQDNALTIQHDLHREFKDKS